MWVLLVKGGKGCGLQLHPLYYGQCGKRNNVFKNNEHLVTWFEGEFHFGGCVLLIKWWGDVPPLCMAF